jgi:glutathione peroxidase-family protein
MSLKSAPIYTLKFHVVSNGNIVTVTTSKIYAHLAEFCLQRDITTLETQRNFIKFLLITRAKSYKNFRPYAT